MAYNQKYARAGTRAVPAMSKVGAVVGSVGAAFCFYAAIAGLLTGDIPVKRSLLFGGMGVLFLGSVAYQIAMGRWAQRIVKSWGSTRDEQSE